MVSKIKRHKSRKINRFKPLIIILTFLTFVGLISIFKYNTKVKADNPGINLGVMGDSFSDEYQADDHRGGDYYPTTFNWLELLVKNRGVNMGSWGSRPSPRRTGYEYNWAMSGARCIDVINWGQDTGLAGQVRQGLITDVLLHVGANDFAIWNGTYAQFYNTPEEGGLTDEQIQDKVNAFVDNVSSIVDTIKAAGNVHMMVSNLADRGLSPVFQQQFPDSTKRQRVTNAVIAINNGLASLAQTKNITILDQFNLGNSIIAKVDANGNYKVGSESISLFVDGDEPHHMLLGDHEHVGTVMSGVIDNEYFIKAFNQSGYNITPFSDQELLTNANIILPSNTPLPTPTVFNPTPTNSPTLIPTDTPVIKPTATPIPPTPTSLPTPTKIPPTSTPRPTALPTPTVRPVINKFPFTYQITSGTYISGNVQSMTANDNNYFTLRSTTSGYTRQSVADFGFDGFDNKTLKPLTVDVILKSSLNNTNIILYLYDFTYSRWVQLGSFTASTGEVSKSYTISSNLVRYINSQGQAGVRILSNISGNKTITSYIEYLRLTEQ